MLKNVKELASDSVIYGSTTILSQLISLILVPFFSKELSPEEYGILSLVAMVISFLEPVVGMGMDSALFRYFAKSKDNVERSGYFSLAFVIKSSVVTLVFLALLPFHSQVNNLIFSGELTERNYYVFLTTFITNNIASVAFVILRADRKVKRISLINLVSLIVGLGLSIYFVLILKGGVTGALLATMCAAIIKGIMFLQTIFANFSGLRFERVRFNQLMKYGLPQVPHKIQARILSLFTLFIVNEKLGLAMAGLYVMAKKFSKPISLVVSTVQTSWAPYKFQIHREEKDPIDLFRRIIPLYWVLLIFLWSLMSVISPWLFRFLIDSRYHEAIPFIPFIMMLPVLEGFRFTINTGFELSDRQNRAALASFVGLAVFVALSLSTINFYSPFSFIVSQGIAYLIMGFILYREARKVMVINYPFGLIVPYYLLNVATVAYLYVEYNWITISIALLVVGALGALIMHRLYSLPKIIKSLKKGARRLLPRTS